MHVHCSCVCKIHRNRLSYIIGMQCLILKIKYPTRFFHEQPLQLGSDTSLAAWLYGDPHFRTLDGFEYTFNGLGEYTLVTVDSKIFTLQCRTQLPNSTDKATVITAFAAKDSTSDRVHIELSNQSNCKSRSLFPSKASSDCFV